MGGVYRHGARRGVLDSLAVRRLLADARGVRLSPADGNYAHGWSPGLAFHYSSHHDRHSFPEHELLSLAGTRTNARCGEVSTIHQVSRIRSLLRVFGVYYSPYDRHDSS